MSCECKKNIDILLTKMNNCLVKSSFLICVEHVMSAEKILTWDVRLKAENERLAYGNVARLEAERARLDGEHARLDVYIAKLEDELARPKTEYVMIIKERDEKLLTKNKRLLEASISSLEIENDRIETEIIPRIESEIARLEAGRTRPNTVDEYSTITGGDETRLLEEHEKLKKENKRIWDELAMIESEIARFEAGLARIESRVTRLKKEHSTIESDIIFRIGK